MVFLSFAFAGCSSDETVEDDRLDRIRQYQSMGRVEAAIPLLRELISEGNRDGEVLYRYGRGLSLIGQPGRGIWALEEALHHEEWFVNASHQIALDAFRGGNIEVALEALERLKAERTDSHDEDMSARVLELRIRVESRRMYEESLELAEDILEDEPENEHVLRLKAVSLLGLKRPDEAYEVITSAGLLGAEEEAAEPGDSFALDPLEATEGEVDLDPIGEPTDDAARVAQVEAYWCTVRTTFKREAGDLEEAEEILDACLAKAPANAGLLSEAGKLYPRVGRSADIEGALVAALEAEPENDSVRMTYVRLLDGVGRVEDAEQLLRDAIDVGRQSSTEGDGHGRVAKSLVDLGAFLVDHDRGSEATDLFAEAIGMLGRRAAPELLLRQAEALTLDGRFDEALALADQTSVDVHAMLIRGRVAFERQDYETAIEELNNVAIVWPDNAPSRYYLARAREGVGDFDLAIEEYRQSMRTDPNLSAPRERLTRLHLAEGLVRQASTILNFVSPLESSTPSAPMRLLGIETAIRMGRPPDLRLPETTEMSLDELYRGAVDAIVRGLATGTDPVEAEAGLAEIEHNLADGRTAGLFLRARVDLLIEGGEAGRAVELARARDDSDPHVSLAIATALVAASDSLDEARTLLDAVESQLAEDSGLHATRGALEERNGEIAAAIEDYERALELDPTDWIALQGLVRTLNESGRSEDAEARLRTFLDRDNPYDGRAALLFAQRDGLEDEERIRYAQRAIRFGAGLTALEYLRTLSPEIANTYRVDVLSPHVPAPQTATPQPDDSPAPAHDAAGGTEAAEATADERSKS